MNSNLLRSRLLIVLLALSIVPYGFSSRNNAVVNLETRTLTITPLGGSNCRLQWTRLPGEGGWLIQSAPNPYCTDIEWTTIASSRQLFADFHSYDNHKYYRVVTDPTIMSTDEVEWIHFDSTMTLQHYANQDSDSTSWQILPNGDNDNALRLYGNTWKVMTVTPQLRINRDFAVGVSVNRESISEWQAIGFQDTSGHTVFYTFGQKDHVADDSCFNSWSEMPPFGYWSRWRLPVGELFAQSFGRDGMLAGLVFVNDNDTTSPAGAWSISRITDASGDQYSNPILTTIIQHLDNLTLQVSGLFNGQPINRGTIKWDGDVDTRADGQSATLHFRTGGDKKILLRWIDIDRTERWAWTNVHLDGPAPVKTSFKYCGCGDLMIARRFDSDGVINRLGLDGLFANIRPYLQSFDLTTANTECTYSIAGSANPIKTYTFRGSPSYLPAIPRNGIQVGNMANNHTGDYGDDALRESLDHNNQIGFNYEGAGLNDGEAWRPAIVYRGGQRIAIFGFCTLTGRQDDPPQEPFLEAAPNKGGFNWARRDLIDAEFAKVRPHVDFLIVQFHVGITEYTITPDAASGGGPAIRPVNDPESDGYDAITDTNAVSLADYMIAHGADLVVCHGPHVPQGVVTRPGGKYIAYSTGNFLFDQYLPETFPSITFEADINHYSQVREARIRPIWLDGYLPGLARGRAAIRIMNHVASLSQGYGTALVEPSDGSACRVVSDSAFFTRVVLPNDTLTIAMRTAGSIAESVPVQFGDVGIVDQVEMSLVGTGTLSYRLGIDDLYGIGDMEDDGAPSTYDFTSGNGAFDDSVRYAGSRSLRVRRTSGTSAISVPTVNRYAITRNSSTFYTIYARMLAGTVGTTTLRLDWWRSRVGGAANGTLNILSPAVGNTWQEMWGDLSQSNIPNNTACFQFNLRNTGTAPTTANMDELAFIEWGTGWTTASSLTLPNPHRWTHLQVSSSNTGTTQARVILHRSKLVQLARN